MYQEEPSQEHPCDEQTQPLRAGPEANSQERAYRPAQSEESGHREG